jgi:hypothetical protein
VSEWCDQQTTRLDSTSSLLRVCVCVWVEQVTLVACDPQRPVSKPFFLPFKPKYSSKSSPNPLTPKSHIVNMSNPLYCVPTIQYHISVLFPLLASPSHSPCEQRVMKKPQHLGPQSSPVARCCWSQAAAAALLWRRQDAVAHADGGAVGDAREVRMRDGDDGPCMGGYRLSRECCVNVQNDAAAALLSGRQRVAWRKKERMHQFL